MSVDVLRRSTTVESPSHSSSRTSLPGYLLLAGTHRLRRSKTLGILQEIRDAPFASPGDVQRNQLRRLSALLAHAEERVPYYRELFRSLGVTSRDIRTLDDFARLPILTKDIIRERGRDLIREDVPLEQPAPAPQRRIDGRSADVLPRARLHGRVGRRNLSELSPVRLAARRDGRLLLGQQRAAAAHVARRVRAAAARPARCTSSIRFTPGPAEMEGWLRRWPRLGATIAFGYASTVARFAEFLEASGRRVAPLRGVFTTAEKLYPQQRAVISRVFGCRVYDLYGSSEVQNIAAECPHGRMHVNADFVVLEAERAARSARRAAAHPDVALELRDAVHPLPQRGLRRSRRRALRLRQQLPADDAAGRAGQRQLRAAGRPRRPRRVLHAPDVRQRRDPDLPVSPDGARSHPLWVVPDGGAAASARARVLDEAVRQIRRSRRRRSPSRCGRPTPIPLSLAGKHRLHTLRRGGADKIHVRDLRCVSSTAGPTPAIAPSSRT